MKTRRNFQKKVYNFAKNVNNFATLAIFYQFGHFTT